MFGKVCYAEIKSVFRGFVKVKVNYRNVSYIAIIIIVMACRIISVWVTPDVFRDEEEILNHLYSLIHYHTDNYGNFMPLFSRVGVGLTTYCYMYPMAALGCIVGVSAVRIRVLQQIITICACFLTACAVYIFTNRKSLSQICLFVSLTIPWGFVQANRIWDPALVPFYFSVYFLFFSLLIKKKFIGIKTRFLYLVISFSFLVLIAVVYPPCRIPAVVMWLYSLIWGIKEKIIGRNEIIVIIITSVIFSLPLAINMLTPGFNKRTTSILVFQGGALYKEIFLWATNFAKMISPEFLFLTGDNNYRHSVPVWGVLGSISVIPIVCCLREKLAEMARYMLFIIFVTFLSVALTNEGIPHSLRGCLAWLPFSVIISIGWDKIISKTGIIGKVLCISTIGAGFIIYFGLYMVYYTNLSL